MEIAKEFAWENLWLNMWRFVCYIFSLFALVLSGSLVYLYGLYIFDSVQGFSNFIKGNRVACFQNTHLILLIFDGGLLYLIFVNLLILMMFVVEILICFVSMLFWFSTWYYFSFLLFPLGGFLQGDFNEAKLFYFVLCC